MPSQPGRSYQAIWKGQAVVKCVHVRYYIHECVCVHSTTQICNHQFMFVVIFYVYTHMCCLHSSLGQAVTGTTGQGWGEGKGADNGRQLACLQVSIQYFCDGQFPSY